MLMDAQQRPTRNLTRFILVVFLRQTSSSHRLCPQSLTTPCIVHYLASTPFCSAVQTSSGNYCTLYSGLKVFHNASRKVVYNRWSHNIHHQVIALREKWRLSRVWKCFFFFFLLMSSRYSPPCWTPYVVTREQGMSEWHRHSHKVTQSQSLLHLIHTDRISSALTRGAARIFSKGGPWKSRGGHQKVGDPKRLAGWTFSNFHLIPIIDQQYINKLASGVASNCIKGPPPAPLWECHCRHPRNKENRSHHCWYWTPQPSVHRSVLNKNCIQTDTVE